MTAPVTTKPLLAYSVQEECEGTGGIVFAKSNAQARREGSCRFSDGDFDSVTCRRAPEFDGYAEQGYVPSLALIKTGWWHECQGCGVRITSCGSYIEDGESDWTLKDAVEPRVGVVFHSQACLDADTAHNAERMRRQDRAIERFKRIVRRRFPDAVFPEKQPGQLSPHHAYASTGSKGWYLGQVCVSFEFPGMMISPARLRWERESGRKSKPYYAVANGDREAFQAYAKATKGAVQ